MALNLGLITVGIPGWQQLSGAVATTYAKVCHFGRQVQKHIGGGNTYMVRHDFEYGSSKKYTSEDFTRFMAVAESDLADYQQSGDQQFLTRARQYTDFIEDECPDSMKFRAKQLRAKYKLQSAKQLFADYQKGGSGSSKSLLLASSAAKEAFQKCPHPEKGAAQVIWVDCLLEEARLSLISYQNETGGKVDYDSLRLAQEGIEEAEKHCLASQTDAVQTLKNQIAIEVDRCLTPERIAALIESTENDLAKYQRSGKKQHLSCALSTVNYIIRKVSGSRKFELKLKELQGKIQLELAIQRFDDYKKEGDSSHENLKFAHSAAQQAVNQCPAPQKEAAREVLVTCLLEGARLNLASFRAKATDVVEYERLRCAKEQIRNAEKHCLAHQRDEVQALKKEITDEAAGCPASEMETSSERQLKISLSSSMKHLANYQSSGCFRDLAKALESAESAIELSSVSEMAPAQEAMVATLMEMARYYISEYQEDPDNLVPDCLTAALHKVEAAEKQCPASKAKELETLKGEIASLMIPHLDSGEIRLEVPLE